MTRIPKTDILDHHGRVNFQSFDFNLLRTLDALLVTCNVSAASKRLNLSQPATSSALARLREALHDPILIRKGNRMIPTPLAEELRPRVTRVLEDIGNVLGTVVSFKPATTERRFRIGANDYASLVLLAPLAQRLRLLAPHATLEIFSVDHNPDMGLATRELDLVIADGWSLRDIPNQEILFRETFVSIARAGHPRLSKRPTLREFLREDHALISTRGVTPGAVDSALEAMQQSRRIALTLPHYLVAPIIVAQTDLIMTLPCRVVACFSDEQSLRSFTPPFDVTGFNVTMVSHPRSIADQPIQWLMQILRTIAVDIGVLERHDKKMGRGNRGLTVKTKRTKKT